jgi:U3 small nucleolar RNA-associated protein 7
MADDEDVAATAASVKKDDPTIKSLPKYKRGQNVDHKAPYRSSSSLTMQKIKDKKLRGNLQKMQKRFGELAYNAARSEMLLPEDRGYLEAEGMEKTYKFTQEQIRKEVDVTTAQKV